MRFAFKAFGVALFITLACGPGRMVSESLAQQTMPHPDMSKPGAKDPYSGKYNWDGELCCNGEDCQQAVHAGDFKPVKDGILVKPTGEVVPQGNQGISPDGQWHICRWPAKTGPIRCLLVPNGGV